MESKTKYKLQEHEINNICLQHFKTTPSLIEEVVSGFYATIFKLKINDDFVVLKISPKEDVDIMTYEKDIIYREVKVYKLLEEKHVPVPKVLVFDDTKNIIPCSYYFMSYIDGDNLFNIKDSIHDMESIIKHKMKLLSQIHTITMDTFGYDNMVKHYQTMSETYLEMINNILKDGKRKNVEYSTECNVLLKTIPSLVLELDVIKVPSLLHHDLWEGNVLVKNQKIVGILDTERSYNGDPLSDFAAMHIDIFNEENSCYVDYYNQFSTNKIILNKNTFIRHRLYQFYMYLLMYVECSYRDIDGSFNDQKNWCNAMFKTLCADLSFGLDKFKEKKTQI